MKNLAFISCFLFSLSLFAQFTDDFSDGDFTANPAWTGDVNKFLVNGDGQLQLNAPSETGTAYLSTPSTAIKDAVWEFWVKLNFTPSTSNYARFYLLSDNADLTASLNGYFLRIGYGSGTNKELNLYRQNGSSSVRLTENPAFLGGLEPVDVKIKVTRSAAGEWEIFAQLLGETDYSAVGAPAVDNTYTTSHYSGMLCNYTSTRRTDIYFDDISITGDIYADETPPTVSSISAENNQVTVLFSEAIADVTAQNFSVAETGNPVTAELSANKTTVTLTFASSFEMDKNYTLSINNVTDLAGNPLEQTDCQFLIPAPSELPQAGDLAINEIMFDSADNSDDYVEIYNLSDNNLDLSGLYFARYTATTTQRVNIPAGTVILRQSCMAFAANPAGLRAYFSVPEAAKIVATTFGTSFLPNSGATFELTDGTTVFDQVSYSAGWHDSEEDSTRGISLEKVNPELLTSDPQSWKSATEAVKFGTPGYENSRYENSETILPSVFAVNIVSKNQLEVIFSKPVVSAEFALEGMAITSTQTDDFSFTLALSADLMEKQLYILKINAIDNFNNQLETERQVFITEPLEMGDLVINEIMFVNPDDADEYVEIYNLSDKFIDVSGLRITVLNSSGEMTTGYSVPAGAVIFPESYLGLVRRPDVVRDYYELSGDIPLVAMPFPTTSFLNNAGATVFLTNGDRDVIYDQVSYQATWHDAIEDTRGISLEKVNPEVSPRDPQNWQSATEMVKFGTPGYENSRYQGIENIMPRVLAVNAITADVLEVVFSKPMSSAVFSMEKTGITPNQTDEFTFSLTLDQMLDVRRVYILTVEAVDFHENQLEINEYKVGVPELPEPGDLVFNEIMPNSAAGSEDYIEIYNLSDKVIDLTGVYFMRVTSSSELIVNIPAGTVIFPRDYVAFAGNTERLRKQFNTPEEANIASVNLGTFLPNSTGTVQLTNGVILFDELSYSDRWHSPLITNRQGIALERINPNAPTQDASNWHSAAWNVNWGTPGYKNSQFRDDTPIKTGKRVWAEPENFTPDNDGHNDVTNIYFSTGDIGFFATIFIYDAVGRKLRTLADNTLISPEAFIRWDGTDDNGQIVNVGIYAVYAEIIRTDGKKEQFKFPCVVSATKK